MAVEAARVSRATLPIIDVDGLGSPDIAARGNVAAALRAACSTHGFFYIRNHGVPEPLVAAVFAEAERLFALPADEKAAIDKAKSAANRGYESLNGQIRALRKHPARLRCARESARSAFYREMAGATGLEPAASSVTG
jgi:isopenicillin N synthase-like dioxygenase